MDDINDDDLLEFIETHRQAFRLMDEAGDAYDVSDEQEGGELEKALLVASRIERRLFSFLLKACPNTWEGKVELVCYVADVAKRQDIQGHREDGLEVLMANLRESGWREAA